MNDVYLKKIGIDKTKFNWNKNPIPMKLFLSFLTVPVERQSDFLGSDNGWTKLTGDNNLIILGGIVNGVEYLDVIQYGKKLHNQYNNYVNPFYLFDIMNESGKAFFIEYFKADINRIINELKCKYSYEMKNAQTTKQQIEDTASFWNDIGFKCDG